MRWTKEWPTEPGAYWFYGHYFGEEKLTIHLVKVKKISNGITYVANGHFMWKAERHEGAFLPVTYPGFPDLDMLE